MMPIQHYTYGIIAAFFITASVLWFSYRQDGMLFGFMVLLAASFQWWFIHASGVPRTIIGERVLLGLHLFVSGFWLWVIHDIVSNRSDAFEGIAYMFLTLYTHTFLFIVFLIWPPLARLFLRM